MVRRTTASRIDCAHGVSARSPRRSRILYGAAALAVALVAAAVTLLRDRVAAPPARSEWVPLTEFTDSAEWPALSPDGRMLSFVRGGQVYIKLLPDGDPVPLTDDDSLKTNPRFSPDGALIAYTVSAGV